MVELDCRRRKLDASVAPSGTMEPGNIGGWPPSAAGMISDSCSHRLSLRALEPAHSSRAVPSPPSPFVVSVTAMLMPEFDWVPHPCVGRESRLSSAVPKIFCALVVKGPVVGAGGAAFDLRPGSGKTNFEECPISGSAVSEFRRRHA